LIDLRILSREDLAVFLFSLKKSFREKNANQSVMLTG